MKRTITKVAVLGSGVMGSRLACHFANIGLEVLLLDITDASANRNKIVNDALAATLKANPSAIYKKDFAKRIHTGNFEDDMKRISDCDWILEAVVERLDIKEKVFIQVEQYRKPGTLITSNTSGIPIHLMIEGRSDDFKKHFCGTHFFNPPRYLRLLEIIPSKETSQEVIDFLTHYGDLYLGKRTVLCKDTPAFIANRIGVFSICAIFQLMKESGLSVEDIDNITGTISGRPKSATFRTCDVVGLDTLIKVAKGVYENCPNDEWREIFNLPDFIFKMEEQKMLGDKTGKGFYQKVKGARDKSEIQSLDINTLQYKAQSKTKFSSIGKAKPVENLKERLRILHNEKDAAADFLRKLSYHIFSYVSLHVPEISDETYRLDDAMVAGFGWEIGPFEQWDNLGVAEVAEEMRAANFNIAPWVNEMLAAGNNSFYRLQNGQKEFYDIASKSYKKIPGRDAFIILENLKAQSPVYKNAEATLHDIGDEVLCLEFHSKMNTIGGGTLEAINKSIEIAEKNYRGLVIGNDAPNFSAGANIGMIFMMAIDQDYDELNFAIKYFQDTMMRCRYSAIPVVNAPHGLTLGGACEMTMHCDASVASAETYIGLVEVGVGVIPGGGGTKEMVLRASDSYLENDPMLPKLQDKFVNIATAKVATSAHEGFDLSVLLKSKPACPAGGDEVIINNERLIAEAKRKVLELSAAGYSQPAKRDDILVLGRTALGALYAGTEGFFIGGYATEHDKKIVQKLAYVMCGGDLTQATKVSEQYLLDLEREAFLSLCSEKKTLERIQSILTKGKALRN